jgi:hypothetical protein
VGRRFVLVQSLVNDDGTGRQSTCRNEADDQRFEPGANTDTSAGQA